jgi:hypothetical protein
MLILSSISTFRPVAQQVQDVLPGCILAIGEFKGYVRAIDESRWHLPYLSLLEVQGALSKEHTGFDWDEFIWLSGAEEGSQERSSYAELYRWTRAYMDTWERLQQRPVFSTSLMEHMMSVALGRRKKVRVGSKYGADIQDWMRVAESYIHLADEWDPITRSYIFASALHRLKPFHQHGDPLQSLLPSMLIATTYEIPLPLFGLSRQTSDDPSRVYNEIVAGLQLTIERMESIRSLRQEAVIRAKELLPARMQSPLLFSILFSKPAIKVKDLVEGGLVQRQTAAEYLRTLEEVRLLEGRTIGRERVYRNAQIDVGNPLWVPTLVEG